jgi:predicted small lipoprotein YifL
MYFPRENKAAEITQSTGESVTYRHVDAILSGVLAGCGKKDDET